MNTLESSFSFADLNGLSNLRREAAADTPEARRAVAQQFEALFLNMMLKQMRDASTVDGGLIDRDRMRFHEDMFDNQLSLTLSQGQGIGLADSIFRQLGPPIAAHREGELTTPSAFVDGIRPPAERTARILGVPADALVAQAGLETEWGQRVIRGVDGTSSHNLFGVRAGSEWTGPRVSVPSLDVVAGVPEPRREAFRAYPDIEASFADYVSLLTEDPRYRAAREATSIEGFAQGVEAAGHGRAPDYAARLIDIVQRGLPERGERA